MLLEDDAVHVWYTPTGDVPESALAWYSTLLSPSETARNNRFVFAADRQRDLVARALVRTTLSRYADVDPRAWVFQPGAYGKPEVAGPAGAPAAGASPDAALCFSLTHTDGLVAIAVGRHRGIGLDAEHLNRPDRGLDVAPRFFAPAEVDDLRATPASGQHRRFLEYWTLKEAYIKAVGAGLSMSLDSFSMRLTDPPAIDFAKGQDDASAWQFARLEVSDAHLVALAVRARRAPALSVRSVLP